MNLSILKTILRTLSNLRITLENIVKKWTSVEPELRTTAVDFNPAKIEKLHKAKVRKNTKISEIGKIIQSPKKLIKIEELMSTIKNINVIPPQETLPPAIPRNLPRTL